MAWNYYPCGMSREDLIHVGEIEDEDAMPEWFEEMLDIDDENAPDIAAELWADCMEDGKDHDDYCSFNHAFERYWAHDWIKENYPEYAVPDEFTNALGETYRWSERYEEWLKVADPRVWHKGGIRVTPQEAWGMAA